MRADSLGKHQKTARNSVPYAVRNPHCWRIETEQDVSGYGECAHVQVSSPYANGMRDAAGKAAGETKTLTPDLSQNTGRGGN